jgi:hypothetical protein
MFVDGRCDAGRHCLDGATCVTGALTTCQCPIGYNPVETATIGRRACILGNEQMLRMNINIFVAESGPNEDCSKGQLCIDGTKCVSGKCVCTAPSIVSHDSYTKRSICAPRMATILSYLTTTHFKHKNAPQMITHTQRQMAPSFVLVRRSSHSLMIRHWHRVRRMAIHYLHQRVMISISICNRNGF